MFIVLYLWSKTKIVIYIIWVLNFYSYYGNLGEREAYKKEVRNTKLCAQWRIVRVGHQDSLQITSSLNIESL